MQSILDDVAKLNSFIQNLDFVKMTVLNSKAMVNTIRKTGRRLLFKVVKAVEKPKKKSIRGYCSKIITL